MPRPRLKDDAEVLDAVGRIVARRGLAWTLADVAGEAGLAPATLVQRFGSKRGVTVAFAEQATARVGEIVRAAAPGGPIEVLLAMAEGVGSADELANHAALLQADLLDPDLRALTRASFDEVEGVLAEQVGAATARALLTAYNGSLILWAVRREGALADWLRRDLEAVLDRSPAA